jgi:hypothetical protein
MCLGACDGQDRVEPLPEKWEGMDLSPALEPDHPIDYCPLVGNDDDFIARRCRNRAADQRQPIATWFTEIAVQPPLPLISMTCPPVPPISYRPVPSISRSRRLPTGNRLLIIEHDWGKGTTRTALPTQPFGVGAAKTTPSTDP